MKRWILPTFFVWSLVGAIAIAAYSGLPEAPVQVVAGPGKIAWQASFEEAMKTAREENKPAMLIFESKTCTFCKKMDKTTWRDKRVQEQTRGWVPVKVNGDQRLDLLAAYSVQEFPTALLVSGNGRPFAGQSGYLAPGDFVSFLETSRSKWKS